MAALTGCLGDDDKDKATGTGGAKTPTAASSESQSPSALADPSGAPPASAKPGGSGNPTASDKVNKLDLKVGDCVDFDADNQMSKASCTSEHDAETVGIYTMPSSMTPTSMTYRDDVKAKCLEYTKPVVERQAAPAKYTGTWIFPDSKSWMNNDRTLQCLVMHRDESPMPGGKLK